MYRLASSNLYPPPAGHHSWPLALCKVLGCYVVLCCSTWSSKVPITDTGGLGGELLGIVAWDKT